jgi:hypothetical protein
MSNWINFFWFSHIGVVYLAMVLVEEFNELKKLFDTAAYGFGIDDAGKLFSDKWGSELSSTESIALNDWNHVVLRYDDSDSKINFCINGKALIFLCFV